MYPIFPRAGHRAHPCAPRHSAACRRLLLMALCTLPLWTLTACSTLSALQAAAPEQQAAQAGPNLSLLTLPAYTDTDAIMRVLAGLGGIWKLAVLARVLPQLLRDRGYRWLARNRYSWFGRHEACYLPTPAQRARFLD